ncbi:MAG: helix-turn-helix domain-containing protein [Pyrinomonadaceae bacterium]
MSARKLEDTGDYEAARQAMGELWQRIGERPNVEGLGRIMAGEVLLRAGVLVGIIGSKNQVTGAQETAKNLIGESLAIFESLHYGKKAAEAQIELALCYWRTGEHNEARDYLKEALSRLTTDSELKARALQRLALVERDAACFVDSLRILLDNAPLFEKIKNHMIKGSYHVTLADVLENLWELEKKADYLDRAFIEYAAASYHFEEAGHKPYRANVENNLGYLYFKVHKYKEAELHLDRARQLLLNLKNYCSVAQVDETRARLFLSEKRYAEAERVARSSVRLLDNGGQQGLLSEALIIHGRALVRLECYDQAYAALLRAVSIAQECGAVNRAGEAALIIIEDLGEHLTFEKVKDAFQVSDLVELRQYEHELIEKALIRAEGGISRAAHLLGTSHQHLARMLQGRHRDLLPLRTPAKSRPKRLK